VRRALWSPTGRRREFLPCLPVFAELIVEPALLLVLQDFVGLVQLLELFFRGWVVLVRIRVIPAREGAVRLADFLCGGRAADTEDFVVVAILDRHRCKPDVERMGEPCVPLGVDEKRNPRRRAGDLSSGASGEATRRVEQP